MTRDDITWFKSNFAAQIQPALAGTPFTVDFLAAIACQETGPIWASLRRTSMPVAEILATCVGDVIDGPGRKAFPVSKATLMAAPNGAAMFTIARQALERMSGRVKGFQSAAKQPHKFCRAYGIFQYNLQHFRIDPDYFLEQRYLDFGKSLDKALIELKTALRRNALADRATLNDLEQCGVAIAYNRGSFDPQRGLKQGHFDGERFYGEQIFDFLRLARSVSQPGVAVPLVAPPPGVAALPAPTPIAATGPVFEVDVRDTPLRLRSAPAKSETNVIARLPDGLRVQAVTGTPVKDFLEVETSLNGALLRGFAAHAFLVPLAAAAPAARTGAVAVAEAAVPVLTPAASLPTSGVIAVEAPRQPGTITRRADIAGAQSLNEAGQPTRTGTTPDALRRDIDAIIDFLDVERASHKRYAPRDKMTFCNIYAHDFCHLADVYLPRVWWTGPAIEKLAQGQIVAPKLGTTIAEVRANDLFRWLADFGLRFGWRQTGTLSKLQMEVNQGALGLIVARRVDNGRPGHITIVVPETGDAKARRAPNGDVIAPLQSQAGSRNFSRGTGTIDWWKGAQFAESAFWLHA